MFNCIRYLWTITFFCSNFHKEQNIQDSAYLTDVENLMYFSSDFMRLSNMLIDS